MEIAVLSLLSNPRSHAEPSLYVPTRSLIRSHAEPQLIRSHAERGNEGELTKTDFGFQVIA